MDKSQKSESAWRQLAPLMDVDQMTRARGQSSRTVVDREFPHRVLVLAESIGGKALDRIIAFHEDRAIPQKSRSIRKDDAWYALYCFADPDHAKQFRVRFGGEMNHVIS